MKSRFPGVVKSQEGSSDAAVPSPWKLFEEIDLEESQSRFFFSAKKHPSTFFHATVLSPSRFYFTPLNCDVVRCIEIMRRRSDYWASYCSLTRRDTNCINRLLSDKCCWLIAKTLTYHTIQALKESIRMGKYIHELYEFNSALHLFLSSIHHAFFSHSEHYWANTIYHYFILTSSLFASQNS